MNEKIERMDRISGFPPLLGERPRVLVLGSMPGLASLQAQQYYAHPRNAFWTLMGRLIGFSPALPYPQRVQALTAAGVAVWDVLQNCRREGSADAAIVRDSLVVNDFAALFAAQPHIAVVACNGGAAWEFFRRYVQLDRANDDAGWELLKLPSTSPAHAALSLEDKYAAWRVLRQWL